MTRNARRPLLVRAYGALLGLLPRELRQGFRDDAQELFQDLYRERVARRGRGSGVLLWIVSVVRLLQCALGARAEAQRGGVTIGPRRVGRHTGGDMLGGLVQDIRYAARSLAKGPGFALTAILILAAGIGATSTIFSVVDTVVLKPLPYPDAGRLVHFDRGAHSYPNFRAWRAMDSFELLSAARDYQVDLTGEGPPERIPAEAVSEDFFRLFGAGPYLGRLFGPGDYPGDRSVSVVSHGLWTRLGADEGLLGRSLMVDGRPTTVVGVLDPRFEPPVMETGRRVDIWFALDDGGEEADDHGLHVLGVAARLKPGVGVDAAQAEVDAQRAAIAREVPSQYVGRDGSLELTPLVEMHEATVRHVSAMLYLLLGAVGLMLLIACANVANLFLARGTAKSREIALRGALGASRSRIAGQILTESLLLSLLGGALGVALAVFCVRLLAGVLPDELPRVEQLAVDPTVLAFSAAVSMLTGVLFGTLPALQALREDVSDALKDAGSSVTASRRGRGARSALVVTEVALAVVLVAGAGLLFRSFVAMIRVDPGFDASGIVILPLELDAEYEPVKREQFARDLIASIERMPGTKSIGLGWALPFARTGRSRCCWRTTVRGDPALFDESDPFRSIIHPVTDEYFATLGMPFVSGRAFVPADADGGDPVAILNARAAAALFGDAEAVGRTIELRDDVLTVVGVVAGVHHWGLDQEVEQAVYVQYFRYGIDYGDLEVAVRTEATAEAIGPELRGAVWAIDPDLPVGSTTTMEARIGVSMAQPRFLSGLLGAFALIALLMACGGIYGSMLYTVGQRRHEMGIRLALGAAGADVIGLVLSQGARLALGGVLIGTLAGLALSGVLRQLLWGVQPTDPVTFAGSALVLAATALLASFIPAWRASRADPLRTLKAE